MSFMHAQPAIDMGGPVPRDAVQETGRGRRHPSFRSKKDKAHQPSVAIQEPMARLHRIMGDRDPDQRTGAKRLIVQNPPRIRYRVPRMAEVRRARGGIAQAEAGGVLAEAEPARLIVCAASTLQQDTVRLAEKPDAEGRLFRHHPWGTDRRHG